MSDDVYVLFVYKGLGWGRKKKKGRGKKEDVWRWRGHEILYFSGRHARHSDTAQGHTTNEAGGGLGTRRGQP